MWISTLCEAGLLGEGPHDGSDDGQPRGSCPLCRVSIRDIDVEVQRQAISTPPPEPAAELEVPDTPDSFAPIQSYAVEGQPLEPIDQFPVWVSIKGQETELALLDVEFIALETATSLRSGVLGNGSNRLEAKGIKFSDLNDFD